MDSTFTYLKILLQSLEKKKTDLICLVELTEEQKRTLEEEPFDLQHFDELIIKKEQFIQDLNESDEGFQSVYERIAPVIKNNKENYKEQILAIQEQIKEISELSVRIQSLELHNKGLLEHISVKHNQKLKYLSSTSRVMKNYTSHMANQHQNEQSYFLDKKK